MHESTGQERTLPSRSEHDKDKYSDHVAQLRHEELISVLYRIADNLDDSGLKAES